VFLRDIQYNPTCVYDIEEGRGHMRMLSSQEVTKNDQNGAVRESMKGMTVNLLMCDRGGTLYYVHAIVY
jgi:hypothetical protein